MQKVNLYRYEEQDGSVTITPTQRKKTDKPYKLRLVADEGMVLTNGEVQTYVIDIDFSEEENWREETDNPIEPIEEE